MSRGIVTAKMQAAGARAAKPDDYLDRVAKYIPGETVALWAAIGGVIPTAPESSRPILLWISFGVGLVLTAFYIWTQVKEMGTNVAITQTAVSTIAFAVWVFAIGGPFAELNWYHPTFGSFLLIIYSFAAGAIVP